MISGFPSKSRSRTDAAEASGCEELSTTPSGFEYQLPNSTHATQEVTDLRDGQFAVGQSLSTYSPVVSS